MDSRVKFTHIYFFAEFSQGMILPRKDGEDAKTKESINNISAGLETKVQMNNSNHTNDTESSPPTANSEGKSLSTTTIKMTQKFQCTGEELYNALTCYEVSKNVVLGNQLLLLVMLSLTVS